MCFFVYFAFLSLLVLFFGVLSMFRFTVLRSAVGGMFHSSPPLAVAHWFAGHKFRHRFMRDKRFHPSHQASHDARNRFSRQRHFKTNRWNYTQAYKDVP